MLNWHTDGWIIVTGVLCAVACALPGAFLVLRKQSMMGDAISHSVLPGIAGAFFLSGSRAGPAVFLGAAGAGVLTAYLTEWIRGKGRVDEGAAMGVVFTSLFALGLVMMVSAADKVDLDPSCVLYGALELTPLDTVSILGWRVPRAAAILACVAVGNAALTVLMFKELRIASFDPALSSLMRINPRVVHYAIMTSVAVTTVAAFESVGNVLVVAMLIVPAATASLLVSRLSAMLWVSVGLAALSAVLGHAGAVFLPRLAGFASTGTAGSMAAAAGLLFVAGLLLSPSQGLLPRAARRLWLRLSLRCDDLLAELARLDEQGVRHVPLSRLAHEHSGALGRFAMARLRVSGFVRRSADGVSLSTTGVQRAALILRAHRLWESYLVQELASRPDHVHGQAHVLEHITDKEMRDRLASAVAAAQHDPHGKQIPTEPDATR
ncbi:MAG: metal ABC transporter permease [Phycisphaeraceae bacterium]|nr:metal ABC transporter permease [Phycisphaeraceae bacterium]